MAAKKDKGYTRLTFDLSPEVLAHLEEIKRRGGHATNSETFMAALIRYEVFLDLRESGVKVCLHNADGSHTAIELSPEPH